MANAELEVSLHLSMDEAEVLHALVGGVETIDEGFTSRALRNIHSALSEAGVNPDETFSDLFEGSVEVQAS